MARMARNPSPRVHAMKASGGRWSRASLAAGNVTPHNTGVRSKRIPGSTDRLVRMVGQRSGAGRAFTGSSA
jgi:hypothetical protein